MKNNLSKILNIFIAVIAVIGAFLFINIFMSDEGDTAALSGSVGSIVTFSTILLYFAVGTTLLLSLFSLFTNPENLKKTLVGVAALGVVLVFAYLIEFAQYFNLLKLLNLEDHKLITIILGSTFQVGDLVAYTFGIITVLIIEQFNSKPHELH